MNEGKKYYEEDKEEMEILNYKETPIEESFEEELIIKKDGQKVKKSSSKSRKFYKLINMSMKNGRECFYREKFSFYEQFKYYFFGIICFGILIKFFLIYATLLFYVLFMWQLVVFEYLFGLNPLLKQHIRRFVVRPGGRWCLFLFGIFNFKILKISKTEMNEIIKDFPGRRKKDIIAFREFKKKQLEKLKQQKEKNGENEENEKEKEEKKKKIWDFEASEINYKNPYNKQPYIIVSNHVAITDMAVIMCYARETSFIMKENLQQIPIVGTLSKEIKCMYVSNKTKGKIIPLIKRRATEYYENKYESNQLFIFPESTTSNQTHVLKFHSGPFVPRAPIKILCIRHPFKHFNPSWSGMIGHDFLYLWHYLSQFQNHLELVNFPEYIPTEVEKANLTLFAENVRRLMVFGSNKKSSFKLNLGIERFVRSYKPKNNKI